MLLQSKRLLKKIEENVNVVRRWIEEKYVN